MAGWDVAADLGAARVAAAGSRQGSVALLDVDSRALPPRGPGSAPSQEFVAAALRAATDAAGPVLWEGALGEGSFGAGSAPTRVVITHPSAWTEAECSAVREAVLSSGVRHAELLPRSRAIAQYFRATLALPRETYLTVYQLDDRFSEATVLRHTPDGVCREVSAGGGGLVSEELADRATEGLLGPSIAAGDLRRARQLLTSTHSVSIRASAEAAPVYLRRTDCAAALRPLAQACLREVAGAVRAAAPGRGLLAAVYLAGGAARIPGLAELIGTELGFTVFTADEPDAAAALGALAGPQEGPFSFRTARGFPSGRPDRAVSPPTGTPALAKAVRLPQAAPATVPIPQSRRPAPEPAAYVPTYVGEPLGAYVEPPAGPPAHPAAGPADRPGGPGLTRMLVLIGVAAFLVSGVLAYFLLPGRNAGSTAPTPPGPVVTSADGRSASPQPTRTTDSLPLTGGPTASAAVSDTATPSPTASSPAPTDPAEVVLAYFAAINRKDFHAAWALGGKNLGETYGAYVSGFSTTAHDDATAVDSGTDTAEVQLTATHTDGSSQSFAGPFTVVDGVITHTDFQRTA